MEQDRNSKIADNIARLKETVANHAVKSNRNPESITIIGVSKRFPADFAIEAYKAGITDLGENRCGELLEKKQVLESKGISPDWHMIGTLQRKKVRKLTGEVFLIHSLDSVSLALEIDNVSRNKSIVTPVLLQVNTSGESSKHGFSPDDLQKALYDMREAENIQIKGLMTMAPFTDDDYVLNEVFFRTKELYEKTKSDLDNKDTFSVLSMGMSNDYTHAIKHGATHLRIGTAIFGERH